MSPFLELEQELEEQKQVADQTKAANADLARDKETFQLTIATQSGRIEELATVRDQLSGEVQKEFLGSAVGKTKAQKIESLENAITTFGRSQHRAAGILSN